MAQQNINTGTPNGQDGDFVRDAFVKAEDNFTELYNRNERRIVVTSEWQGNLDFRCTAKSFPIQGEWYNILQPNVTTVTLEAADNLLDRVDLIVANSTTLTIYAVKGEASENPVQPVPNYDEYPLNFVLVRAGETEPDGFEDVTVWDENLGTPNEWDFTADVPTRGPGQTIVPGQVNTYNGLWSLNGSQTSNARAKFTNNQSIPTARLNNLSFYIKLKEDYTVKGKLYVTFDQTSVATQTKSVSPKPEDSRAAVPAPPPPNTVTELTIKRNENGFDPSNTGWQKITLDLGRVNFVTGSIDTLTISPNNGAPSGNALGYYIDSVNLQLLSQSTSKPTVLSDDPNKIEYTSELINNGEGEIDPSGDLLKFITRADLSNPDIVDSNLLNVSVTYLQDLDFRVDPLSFPIDGVWYTGEPNQTISLNMADPTLSRIDIIGVDRFGDATKVTGTASANPEAPNVDESVIFPIKEILVDPAAIVLDDTFSEVQLFNEGSNAPAGQEWVSSIPNTGSSLSSTEAQLGTYSFKHVVKGGASNGFISLTPGALDAIDGKVLEAISFYIKLNSKDINRIIMQLYDGVANRAKIHIINGSYGLDAGSTDWQRVTVPLNTVSLNTDIDRVSFNVSSASSGFQFYMDNIVAYLEDTDLKKDGAAGVTESYVNNAVADKADITYVDTSVSTKADVSYVDTSVSTKAETSYVDTAVASKADATATQTALDAKADELYVDTAVANKADVTYIDGLLNDKADVTYVNTELGDKADSSTVTSQLALKADLNTVTGKADLTYVDNQLSDKADTTTVNTALALKAEKTYVDTELADKADTTSVNTALAAKADTADLALKADTTYVNTELSNKANSSDVGNTAYTTLIRTISSSEIISLGTSPVTLVAAPSIGQAIIPISMVFKYNPGSNPFTANSVSLKMDTPGSTPLANIPANVIGGTVAKFEVLPFDTAAELSMGTGAILKGNNSSNAGDGTIVVLFTYQIVPIA